LTLITINHQARASGCAFTAEAFEERQISQGDHPRFGDLEILVEIWDLSPKNLVENDGTCGIQA